MNDNYTPNQRTAEIVELRQQPDGPGLRYGKRGEATAIATLVPGGAQILRDRIGQFQAESRYVEARIGTVHELRVVVINNDTQAVITVTYDGDFKPYLEDILREGGAWFDALFQGVWEGYGLSAEPETRQLILGSIVTAEMFYVCHQDLSVKDVARLKKLGSALSDLLDAAN